MFESFADSLDMILIFWGLGILIVNFVKPDWFWNYSRMQRRRQMIGDEKTSIMYYIIGALMIGVGIMGRAGFL